MVDQSEIRGYVWHVDDQEIWHSLTEEALTSEGYSVMHTYTQKEALEMIPDKVASIKVAILDGDLKPGSGETIAMLIRESQLPISIVGLSTGEKPWSDTFLSKLKFNKQQLIDTVNGIFENIEQLSASPQIEE
jgi:DNA-binding NtrC family response regulator